MVGGLACNSLGLSAVLALDSWALVLSPCSIPKPRPELANHCLQCCHARQIMRSDCDRHRLATSPTTAAPLPPDRWPKPRPCVCRRARVWLVHDRCLTVFSARPLVRQTTPGSPKALTPNLHPAARSHPCPTCAVRAARWCYCLKHSADRATLRKMGRQWFPRLAGMLRPSAARLPDRRRRTRAFPAQLPIPSSLRYRTIFSAPSGFVWMSATFASPSIFTNLAQITLKIMWWSHPSVTPCDTLNSAICRE